MKLVAVAALALQEVQLEFPAVQPTRTHWFHFVLSKISGVYNVAVVGAEVVTALQSNDSKCFLFCFSVPFIISTLVLKDQKTLVAIKSCSAGKTLRALKSSYKSVSSLSSACSAFNR